MANQLRPYYGEFLFSPIPLELSLVEPCEYACGYCFAVLNDRYWASKKSKQAHNSNVPSVMRLLADFQNRKSLEAVLLQHGYPVLLSNRTDPFGRKNRAVVLPILETFAELGIRTAFQTKGFINPADFDTVMRLIEPSWWYVSISFADDPKRKQVEPGATAIEYRFELIQELVKAGHNVSVGVNPCVPEWVGDPEALVQRIKDAGAYGTFAAALHLSKDQFAQMTERERAAIGPDVMERSRKKKNPDIEFVELFTDVALDAGLESSCQGFSNYTQFWDYCHSCYPKTFPTNQDFVNHCFESGFAAGHLLGMADYLAVMLPGLPTGVHSVGHYIGSSSRAVTKSMGGKWTNYFTFERLLEWYWNDKRLGLSPVHHGCLSYAVRREDEDLIGLVDEGGSPLMVFLPDGAKSYYTDVETLNPIL